jgi:ParB-like chromosome segregation protein Spo0J
VALAGDWPPVVVRGGDNTILDGHYRYLAARQLGLSHLDCIYFEGSSDSAFLEALRRNIRHGLPLSLREREEAGRRLLKLFPDWSDRRIAQACRLAPSTVGRLRAVRSGDKDGHLDTRTGLDGRRYPVDRRDSRSRIIDALQAQPGSSLRSVARLTGASPTTVKAVQTQLARCPGSADLAPQTNRAADAAMLSSDGGVEILRWLERTAGSEEWVQYLSRIPLSRVYEVADEARRRARHWSDFATALEARPTKESQSDWPTSPSCR